MTCTSSTRVSVSAQCLSINDKRQWTTSLIENGAFDWLGGWEQPSECIIIHNWQYYNDIIALIQFIEHSDWKCFTALAFCDRCIINHHTHFDSSNFEYTSIQAAIYSRFYCDNDIAAFISFTFAARAHTHCPHSLWLYQWTKFRFNWQYETL